MFLEYSSRLLVLLPPVHLARCGASSRSAIASSRMALSLSVYPFLGSSRRRCVRIYIYPSLGRVSDVRTVSVSLSILAAIGAVIFVGLQCRVLAIVIHNLCSRQMHGDVCAGLWYPCMCLGSMLPMYHNLSGRLMHGGLSIIT